jgi:hypothetical protein
VLRDTELGYFKETCENFAVKLSVWLKQMLGMPCDAGRSMWHGKSCDIDVTTSATFIIIREKIVDVKF